MKIKAKDRKPIYPYDEWKIVEESFDVETNLRDETIFAVGNGYIGMRGNFEEGYNGPDNSSVNGTYLNGFYESKPIVYGEEAYGYAEKSQTMLNVTDSKIIQLYVDGEPLDLFSGKLISYRRTLDMKEGVLTRDMTWESGTGKQVRIRIQRFACLARKHLAVISYEVTALNFDGEIVLVSALNGEVRNQVTMGDPRAGAAFAGQVLITEGKDQDGTFAALRQRTKNTRFALVCGMENQLETENTFRMEADAPEQMVRVKYTVTAHRERTIRLTKYISYHTSRDYPEEQLLALSKETLSEARQQGFDRLREEQRQFLKDFWSRSDVEIKGDLALQQSIRFNVFHLLQSVGRDGKTNIGAKGITGEGYEGHYFWDTETYIFPFFLYTNPAIGRQLLTYRYSILDKAKERARVMSQKGALYAWRTIGGEETSAYYPAGTAQYHINADIIYALKKYMHATEDLDFFIEAGAEMLFETARLWADLGDYIPRKGNRFCINEVTGPDEYTALVNNNLFTNMMAKDHLEFAYRMAQFLKEKHGQAFQSIAGKIGLQESEIAEWKRAAEHMYIPYDEELGIHPQDDSFLDRAVWNFENTPPDKYPLLLHYHPLVIYRRQVLKQADVVLALFLQGDRFTTAEKKRNYDYYEPITTHDSSLSPCIYSILAAELGYIDKAYNYFMYTARMDLDDIHDNVKDGIHTASMAGTWLSIVHGFAGFREYQGELSFHPVVPEKWEGYRFKITFKGRVIDIDVTRDAVTYTLLSGQPVTLQHFREEVSLAPGKSQTRSLKPKLEAVIFDLDGVITDTAEYHYQAWKQLADEIGVPFDREFNEQLKGIGRLESLELILSRGELQLTEAEKIALADRKNENYKQLIESISPDDLLPGILTLLKQLRENGVKIGLASASKNAPAVLEKLGITQYFDAIADASKIKKGKPDPEIFLTAADLLGVPYRNCIGIEDAEAGIAAIKEAQMTAVGVGNRETLKHADWIVDTTVELTFERLVEIKG
ncbi:beta-phosphoglucomutase [Effusibacillus lacus]|uniref:Beta-phosphoglucomutase n=1 Tax=Effusibacillus lacus TaxID=1348429 RepID=A0A292YK15_9BACL|nr:beta-phosphoglucomutase [Effusibacillus lacus]TCS73602.1 alpha,alpha-trehalose phosphorylase [Effusibacillus lacus]GAX89506.1 beta-phosphoglucomutase [Effusibacillus lacus]